MHEYSQIYRLGGVMLSICMVFLLSFSFVTNEAFGAVNITNRVEINSANIGGSAISRDDLFGYRIENIGDLDGDGVIDLAQISYRYDDYVIDVDGDNNAQYGVVLILFMNNDGSVRETSAITMDDGVNGIGACLDDPGRVGVDILARDPGGLEQLAFIGDLDGNDKPTLALGAPTHDFNGDRSANGAVYMLELNDDGTLDNCLRIIEYENGFNPDAGEYLEGFDAYLGFPLIATDVNGDGQNELIVGASEEMDATGNLWVFFLNTDGSVSSHPAIPILGMTHLEITESTLDRDYITSGDIVDGGGKIVIGVEDGDNLVGNVADDEFGSIHIININSDGTYLSSTEIVGDTLGIGIGQGTGGWGGADDFGSEVAGIGDLNGDGVNDIMVGNIAGDDSGDESGEAYILFMNSDDTVKESQKISNESENTRTGSTPFAGSDFFGQGMALWQDTGTTAVIAIAAYRDDTGGGNSGAIHLFYIERGTVTVEIRSGSNCDDCEPPTFGENKNGMLMVTNGFTYNGVSTDVESYHTEYPLITVVTNQTNTITVKVYENSGVNSIENIQFGMGMPKIGSPLSDAQTLLEIWLDDTIVDEIKKTDKNNLVDIINATTSLVDCSVDHGSECLQLTVNYIYRDQPKYNIMLINSMDDHNNTWNYYLNDGILVIGDSINEPKTMIVDATKAGMLYPQKSGSTTLMLDDYKNDIWLDKFDYKWSTNAYGPYLLDIMQVPEPIPDKYSIWSGYNDRLHSEFPKYVQIQTLRAETTLEFMFPPHFIEDEYVPEEITYEYVIDRIYRKDLTILAQALLDEETKAQLILGKYYEEPIIFTSAKEINHTNIVHALSKFIKEYKDTS